MEVLGMSWRRLLIILLSVAATILIFVANGPMEYRVILVMFMIYLAIIILLCLVRRDLLLGMGQVGFECAVAVMLIVPSTTNLLENDIDGGTAQAAVIVSLVTGILLLIFNIF